MLLIFNGFYWWIIMSHKYNHKFSICCFDAWIGRLRPILITQQGLPSKAHDIQHCLDDTIFFKTFTHWEAAAALSKSDINLTPQAHIIWWFPNLTTRFPHPFSVSSFQICFVHNWHGNERFFVCQSVTGCGLDDPVDHPAIGSKISIPFEEHPRRIRIEHLI